MKLVYALVACAVLSGCATNKGLYDWSGYSGLLYQSYQDPAKAAENMRTLEANILKAEQAGLKVAPGLYADLGTMLLQSGDRDKALINYRKERALWPESAVLMDAMIKNIQPATTKQEAKS